MRLYASSGIRGKVIDLDTNQEIKGVVWLDTDPPGLPPGIGMIEVKDGDKVHWFKGRFKFTAYAAINGRQPELGAPKCVKCGRAITLQGNDLCAFCNASDKGYRGLGVDRRPKLKRKCDWDGCDRMAEFGVSDEVEGTPQPGLWNGKRELWATATTVRQRWYCSFHHQLPRLVDARGEVIQEIESGIRP